MDKEIFILEDDKDIGFMLSHVLLEEGYIVRVFETIIDFRKALNERLPDLLLMDVRLPDGNGMDLCAELKQSEGFNVPVLMMSADWHTHNTAVCQAEHYIAKPFELDDVVSMVDGFLRPAGISLHD